jgi:hypothetical protein
MRKTERAKLDNFKFSRVEYYFLNKVARAHNFFIFFLQMGLIF